MAHSSSDAWTAASCCGPEWRPRPVHHAPAFYTGWFNQAAGEMMCSAVARPWLAEWSPEEQRWMHMAGQGEQQQREQQAQPAQQAQKQQAEQRTQPAQPQQGQQQPQQPQQPASVNRKARSKAQMLHERLTQRAAAPPSPSRVPWQPAAYATEQPPAVAAPQPLVTLELAAGSHISMQTVPPGTAISLEASARGTILLQLSLPPGGKLSFGLGPDAAAPAAAASSSLFGAFPGEDSPVLSHTPVFDWQPAAAGPAFVLRHKPVVFHGISGEGQPSPCSPPPVFGWRRPAADVPQPGAAEHSGGGSAASSPTPPPDGSPYSAAAMPAAAAAAQPAVGQVPAAAAETAAEQVPAAAGATAAEQVPAGEAGEAAGTAGQAALSLGLQDRHWDQPELPPDWHLSVHKGDQLLRSVRLGTSAAAAVRICKPYRAVVFRSVDPKQRLPVFLRRSEWRPAMQLLSWAVTETVCGVRLWSQQGSGLLRPELLPGAAAALAALSQPAAASAGGEGSSGATAAAAAGAEAAAGEASQQADGEPGQQGSTSPAELLHKLRAAAPAECLTAQPPASWRLRAGTAGPRPGQPCDTQAFLARLSELRREGGAVAAGGSGA